MGRMVERGGRGSNRHRLPRSLSRRSLTSVLLVSSWMAVVLRVPLDQRCIIDQRGGLVAANTLQSSLNSILAYISQTWENTHDLCRDGCRGPSRRGNIEYTDHSHVAKLCARHQKAHRPTLQQPCPPYPKAHVSLSPPSRSLNRPARSFLNHRPREQRTNMRFPLLGRLHSHEYSAILFGFVFIAFETVLTSIISILPKAVIQWFYDRSRFIFHLIVGPPKPKTDEERLSDRIRRARDFEKLCEIFGYAFEEHVILTKDGYLLGLHRLCLKRGEERRAGVVVGKPVVYLHHGLLMNSEIWVCLTDPRRCLPFVLVEMGFDVWLGNNRGNKYSKKSIHHDPNSLKFWNYSIDDFAWHDIPDSIEHILKVTKEKSLSYIGFSQGSAQAFAALSIHPQLNERVNVFIALAPAMSPAGLSAPIVDGLMKAS